MLGTLWIESTVQNPDFRLFFHPNTGKYGYSLNGNPIIWCSSKLEAEYRGEEHLVLTK